MAQREQFDIRAMAIEIEGRLRALQNANTEAMRGVRREFSKRLRNAPAATLLGIAHGVLAASRFVAYELINHHPAALGSLNQEELERLGEGIGSWDAVDCFACFLSRHGWCEHQIQEDFIKAWARYKYR